MNNKFVLPNSASAVLLIVFLVLVSAVMLGCTMNASLLRGRY